MARAGRGDGGPGAEDDTGTPVRAAQYLRMSTEHQRYSTENQAKAIAAYAAERGFAIVRTYEDSGRSGLKLSGRLGLQRLLADVESRTADFAAVLAYDISRWGRFQDADESAYYEYVCKRAGVAVHYCAEQFENDGSLAATVMKNIKRGMASEYSRELGVKVFGGHCRQVELGFRQGGNPGYGLRRQLVDEHREPKGILQHGERKSIQTDRVVLVPGPADEVAIVRRIYRMFVQDRLTEGAIATALDGEGLHAELGQRWSRAAVRHVLTAEKYIGNNVYNHLSFKLKHTRVSNPPEMWIRADGAFPAIVDTPTFAAAQALVEARNRRYTDEELLAMLADLLSRRGTLSAVIIDEAEDMPSSGVYRTRFGSLSRAYRLVGYAPARDAGHAEANRLLRVLHPGVVEGVLSGIRALPGATAEETGDGTLLVNGEFTMSVIVCRCTRTGSGALRWKLRLGGTPPDLTVAVRMEDGNEGIRDYYLLPRLDFGTAQVRLTEENGVFLDAYRADDLGRLFRLAARGEVGRAA